MQKRLYVDEAHTALDIFRFAVFFFYKWKTSLINEFSIFFFLYLVNDNNHDVRTNEKFKVIFAKTSIYKNLTISYRQRLLNSHFSVKSR